MKYRVLTPSDPQPDTNPYGVTLIARVLDNDFVAQECPSCGYPALYIGVITQGIQVLPVTQPWCDQCIANGIPVSPVAFEEWLIREDGIDLIGLYSDQIQAVAAADTCRKEHPYRTYTVHPYRSELPMNINEHRGERGPALATTQSSKLICDFCSAPGPARSYDAPDLFYTIRAGRSKAKNALLQGAWLACAECAAFLDAGDRSGLAHRCVAALKEEAGRVIPLSYLIDLVIRLQAPIWGVLAPQKGEQTAP